MTLLTAIYVAGALAGLVAVDGSVATRIGLALVWPIGIAAFVLTITMLIVVAGIAFPVFGIGLVTAAALAGWLMLA
ncbi:MAG: hypothetical protein ABL986_08585 [Vicinamibacterales bacterium]